MMGIFSKSTDTDGSDDFGEDKGGADFGDTTTVLPTMKDARSKLNDGLDELKSLKARNLEEIEQNTAQIAALTSANKTLQAEADKAGSMIKDLITLTGDTAPVVNQGSEDKQADEAA